MRALWGRGIGPRLALTVVLACLGAIPSVRAGEGGTVAGVRLERYVTVSVTIHSDARLTVEPAKGFERACLDDAPVCFRLASFTAQACVTGDGCTSTAGDTRG